MADNSIGQCSAAGCRNTLYAGMEEKYKRCKCGVYICENCLKKEIVWCARCETDQLRQAVDELVRRTSQSERYGR